MLKCCGMLWCNVIAMAFGKCPSAPGSLPLFTTPWSTAKSHSDAAEGNKNSHVVAKLIDLDFLTKFKLCEVDLVDVEECTCIYQDLDLDTNSQVSAHRHQGISGEGASLVEEAMRKLTRRLGGACST